MGTVTALFDTCNPTANVFSLIDQHRRIVPSLYPLGRFSR